MIGALVFTTITSLSGAPLMRPKRLRVFVIPILSVMLGASFTSDVLEHLQKWALSISALVVCALPVTAAVSYYLVRFAKWDVPTAYFSASPGGFSEMALLGEAMGADDRRISLNHSVRIMLTVRVIPFWFKFFEGCQPGNMDALGHFDEFAPKAAAILLTCAVAGYVIAKLLNFPAAQLLGPVILSAIVHMSGVTEARPPGELVAAAQVVIGATIGCRFIGVSVRTVFGVMVQAGAITALMLATALAFAWGVSQVMGVSVTTLWLCFAPGGLAEMALISLSLGIDVAFVPVHHMVRVILLVSVAAFAFKLLEKVLSRIAVKNIPPPASPPN